MSPFAGMSAPESDRAGPGPPRAIRYQGWRWHMKRWAGLSAMLLVLALTAGCPYTTKVPLAVPDPHLFDPRLVGLWTGFGDSAGDSTLVRVIPFNEAEYYVETDDRGREPTRYRVFIFDIGGQQFLHFNEISMADEPSKYCFARYAFAANGDLSLRFVGEEIVPKSLAEDPASLKSFLASHLADSALDDRDVRLVLKMRGGDHE
jgi:hypothetical protein